MLNNSLFKQLAWACYLTCSWTWCIGMFLPVILQKDFGNGAWFFFVIFNIVGATAFSFFIPSIDHSKKFVEQHTKACVLFSTITIVFQLFFIGWVLSYLSVIEVCVVLVLMSVLYLIIKRTDFTVAATVLWFLSLTVFVTYITGEPNATAVTKLTNQFTEINPNAFFALPILALGFLLCPYLDLTFHKVVQSANTKTDRGNRISFIIGFPILFLILMIFSLVYSDTVNHILLNPLTWFEENTILISALFFYFLLQAGFTSMVHWHEVKKHVDKIQIWSVGSVASVAAMTGFYLANDTNEMLYRLFMSFYGIITPAYIWLVAFNKKEISAKIAIIGTALALMLSAVPLLAQNDQYYYCYSVAVAIVLATRFFSVKK